MLGGKRKFVVCEKCSERACLKLQLSNEQNLGYFALYWGVIKPSLFGISRSYCKDPQQPISIMQCHKGFEHCSIDLLFSRGVGGGLRTVFRSQDICLVGQMISQLGKMFALQVLATHLTKFG